MTTGITMSPKFGAIHVFQGERALDVLDAKDDTKALRRLLFTQTDDDGVLSQDTFKLIQKGKEVVLLTDTNTPDLTAFKGSSEPEGLPKTKADILQALNDSKLEIVLKALNELPPQRFQWNEKPNSIILLASRYNNQMKDVMLGISSSSETKMELNRIRYALANLVEKDMKADEGGLVPANLPSETQRLEMLIQHAGDRVTYYV